MAQSRNKGCQVFVPDPADSTHDIECGQPYDSDVTVHLPTGRGTANVRVCMKHKRILNQQAARMRAEARR